MLFSLAFFETFTSAQQDRQVDDSLEQTEVSEIVGGTPTPKEATMCPVDGCQEKKSFVV